MVTTDEDCYSLLEIAEQELDALVLLERERLKLNLDYVLRYLKRCEVYLGEKYGDSPTPVKDRLCGTLGRITRLERMVKELTRL